MNLDKNFNYDMGFNARVNVLNSLTKEFEDIQKPLETTIKDTIKSLSSFIEPHEIQEAKDLVKNSLGFEPPRMCGYYMALKICVDDSDFMKDEKGELIVNDQGIPLVKPTSHVDKKYESFVGLVVAQGPDCYKHEKFEHSGPWCRVGDFVMFPKQTGNLFTYRGYAFAVIPDERVYLVVEEPSYVTKF